MARADGALSERARGLLSAQSFTPQAAWQREQSDRGAAPGQALLTHLRRNGVSSASLCFKWGAGLQFWAGS